jgi:hypothetical protein
VNLEFSRSNEREESNLNLDLNSDLHVSNFNSFQIALCSSMQTTSFIRTAMVGNTSINQLFNEICLSFPPSAHGENGMA